MATRHDSLTGTEIHQPYAFTYANATARTGATGFVTADIGKLAYQTDTASLWLLTATTPVWVAVAGSSTRGANPLTAIGDTIFGSTAGAETRLGIGTIGQALNTVNGAPYLAAPAAPVPTTATTGGTIAAGTYTVGVTYVNAQGETVASTSGTVTTTGTTSTITVPSPPAAGANSQAATGWYAYVSQAGGAVLTRQQAAGSPTAIGTALTLTAPPTSTGAGVPAGNTAGSLVPAWAAAAGGGYSGYIVIVDQKTSGTNGGTFTSGAWRTRDLNTKKFDTGNHATVASNQITLLAGTYQCEIIVPAFAVDQFMAQLQDITNVVTLAVPSSSSCSGSADNTTSYNFIEGRFTLAGTTVLEVQQKCVTTKATVGFGINTAMGVETYTIAKFWRE